VSAWNGMADLSEVEAALAAAYDAAQRVQDQGSTGTAMSSPPTLQPHLTKDDDGNGVT
jgi:hypothetical protein